MVLEELESTTVMASFNKAGFVFGGYIMSSIKLQLIYKAYPNAPSRSVMQINNLF